MGLRPPAPASSLPERALDDAASADRPGGWWIGGSELAPALVMAVLGTWVVLRHHGLWYDEIYTAEVAPLPLGDLWHAFVRGDGTIPYLRDAPPSYNAPYYAVAHVWLALTGLAADEGGLRLLSLAAMVAAAAVFTRAAGRLAGPRVGVAAGLVMATNPFVVQFAAEARGYALALLATSLAALGLARWLDDRPHSLLLFGAAGAAAGLAHWFALLVVASLAVAALVLRGRRALPVAVVAAAASVPALAVVATAVANGVGASGAEWISDVGLAVPRLLVRSWAGGRTALILVTLAAAGVGLWPHRLGVGDGDGAGFRQARVVAAAWFAIPVGVVTAVELVRPVFVDRYLLPAVLGLALAVALGLARPPSLATAGLALAAVLATSVWATVAETRLGPKEDVRGAVEFVAAHHRPGQPVVAAARWDALGVDHYARRDHAALLPDLVLPPATVPPADSGLWVVRRAKGGVKGDRTKLEALDVELEGRGLRITEERRFDGRYADTLVQRWSP